MSLASDALLLSVVAALTVLVASTRVIGRPEGIAVVNLLVLEVLPAGSIAQIRSSKGLVVRMRDDAEVRCFAYGASLLGGMLGYRRAKDAAFRCTEWIQATGDPAGSTASRSRALRPAVIGIPPLLSAAYLVLAVVVRHLAA